MNRLPTLHGFCKDVFITVFIPVLAKAGLVYGICTQIFSILLVDRSRLVANMEAIVYAVTWNSPSSQQMVSVALLSGLVVYAVRRMMRSPSINSDRTQPKLVDRQLPIIIKGLRIVLEGLIAPVMVVLALIKSVPEFPPALSTVIELQLGLVAVGFILLLVMMERLSRVHADPLELVEIRISRQGVPAVGNTSTLKGKINQLNAHEWFTDRVRALLAYTNQVLFVDSVFAVDSETCVVLVGFSKRYADWGKKPDEIKMLHTMIAALVLEWRDREFQSQIHGLPSIPEH